MPDNIFNLNHPDFLGIMLRFIINTFFLFILIRVIYFRYSKKEKFLFTFFLLGIMVFFITSMLKSVFIEFGMAVGLFAIFTILRFRTRNFSLKDMSYIFATIGLSVINSLKLVGFPYLGVIIFNIIVLAVVVILEEFTLRHNTTTYTIIYEDLELLKNGKKQKILKEISALTGKEISRFRIRQIDYKEKIAKVDITYSD
ncbi:MAG TPA: DUF4956 domain-containing protein [Bacteroidales bacterium]|nr:DUF4956 domain-containing protein [Bacteroidales bacterium]HOX75770.1 DUF4956 domain-containing protein [Bacteroidales bacterium]HPM88936.1 DUF4956 domain-containing protein [Bacteroidales bacterium]HQM70828.1 DUF4956 domain-containing protein [Bacteroidales bacterium]